MSRARAVPPVIAEMIKRDAQLLPQDDGRHIDLVEGQLGERVVDELDVFEERRLVVEADVALGAELDVVRFALADPGLGGHRGGP